MLEKLPSNILGIQSLRDFHNVPIPKIKAHNPNEEYYASAYYTRIKELIIDFEEDLNENEEVGLKLVTFGEAITIHIESIGYYNPSILTFTGTTTDGSPARLIQDVTQLSFLLIKVPRTHPERPRIGFKLQQE